MTDKEQHKRWMKMLIGASATVSVVLIVLFSFGERFDETRFAVNPPIAEEHATAYANFFGLLGWDQNAFIKLDKNADLSTLVDLRLFGSLQPDRNPETRFGKAAQVRIDAYQQSWYRYATPIGYAEAGCEKRMSAATAEEVAKAPCFPIVYGYTNNSPESLFHEPLTSQIVMLMKWKQRASWRDVAILDSAGNPVLFFRFRGDHLDRSALSAALIR